MRADLMVDEVKRMRPEKRRDFLDALTEAFCPECCEDYKGAARVCYCGYNLAESD